MRDWFKTFFKQLFCKHDFKFHRNIHGDEINVRGGKRSVWKCSKCEDYEYRNFLHRG